MKFGSSITVALAITLLFAGVVVSCRDNLEEAERLNLAETPLQVVDSMFLVNTKNGVITMRLEAPVMKRYENDTTSSETFPEGIAVYGYNEEGLLETILVADNARHISGKGRHNISDMWSAFGNVVIKNIMNGETMETDTIYWDQTSKEIYTDCYVKMYSPQGFMQGYGMRTDDRARNSILKKPFDSYGVTIQDSTKVMLDSVNFIGPFPEK